MQVATDEKKDAAFVIPCNIRAQFVRGCLVQSVCHNSSSMLRFANSHFSSLRSVTRDIDSC